MKSKCNFCQTSRYGASRGFVLATSLIFLVVLSVLTVMGLRRSFFEERMATNDRDFYTAREAAELALRDAERDIAGHRFDDNFCSVATKATCGGNLRTANTRPLDGTSANWNFWAGFQDQVDNGNARYTLNNAVPVAVDGTNIGVYVANEDTTSCGMSLWLAADWDVNPPTVPARICNNGAIVRTVMYGAFTGAPDPATNLTTPALCTVNSFPRCPRYLIEILDRTDIGVGSTAKAYFRITAVGFGRLNNDAGSVTSVTLQSIFSPS